MKKVIALCIALCLCLTGCTAMPKQTDKVTVVCTLFPQYDFAKTIAGNRAEVLLLLPPGAESHSYEPTPKDIMTVSRGDLFIYTGKELETWAEKVLEGLDIKPYVLDLSQNISLSDHEGHDHKGKDPHIFTNPLYAVTMAEDIQKALIAVDPAGEADYKKAGAAYIEKLKQLDADIRQVVQNSGQKPLVFGERFALTYFMEEYGLSYYTAYDSCSSETEPSAAKVAELCDIIQREKIEVVYYEELSDPKTTRIICEETGAKPLLFHSCHNLSKEEFEKGATYLSLMEQNIEHLKEGLS